MTKLARIIKSHEVDKVARLKPKRYILAVSTPLTPLRKDKLFNLLAPFCLNAHDIFGREDLNNLLGQFSDIEQKNFKLWLTSEGGSESRVACWCVGRCRANYAAY